MPCRAAMAMHHYALQAEGFSKERARLLAGEQLPCLLLVLLDKLTLCKP